MNIDSALEKIYSLKQFHIKLGLDNITNLLNHLDDPQNNIKTIHIAGSNGKGSTASFIASILQEFGYKVGLYTSPHFVRFNERIKINGQEISDEEIIKFLESNKKYIDEHKPTFFEIASALAFKYFSNSKVDYAIIETGLGGRLDATNTIKPLASVITSISLEHSRILGDTLEKIAREKAGIIKNNIPVYIGLLPLEAEKVFLDTSVEKDCKLFRLTNYIDEFRNHLVLSSNQKKYNLYNAGLIGKHQLHNAALAILVLQETLKLKNDKLILKGLKNVVQNTNVQGRYERYNLKPSVIFDAAHNMEGVEVFLNQFKKEFQKYDKTILIYGAMQDKNNDTMLLLLSKYFTQIFITSTNYERAATVDELKNIAKLSNIEVQELTDPNIYIEQFIKTISNDCLLVLGSIYLLGDIKNKLLK
ncbi:MAG: bifunctional folylpolyglutamate synthase/dihydrofolate synthase [Ignavibacteriae bacterium]|nr:bifunctional folylpolyglutamate synthase/dihydrofolate synthase [Ignavibacteriota bacterium]